QQEGDAEDAFWIQKAGLESARMAEALGEWPKAINVYGQLQALPNLTAAFQATLERRTSRARDQLLPVKN
ncbi:MAG: hypothetical protein H7Y43_15285, partial [Akkermansiaceae bacterium]|nr:hypothetical protein [Verrucomicrobiales bacterium]